MKKLKKALANDVRKISKWLLFQYIQQFKLKVSIGFDSI